MSKTILIGIIAGILAIGGGAAYFLTRDSDGGEASSSETRSSEATTSETTEPAPEFNPAAMANQSFVATMTGTTSDGGTYDATIKYDGQGAAHFSGNFSGQTAEFYTTSGRYIVCNAGNCFEYGDNSRLPTLPDYSYDEEEFNNFRNNATYKGEQSCPDGTCSAWEIQQGEYATTVYLNSDGRVSQLDTEGPEGEFTITYEYKDITITLPRNVQKLPA